MRAECDCNSTNFVDMTLAGMIEAMAYGVAVALVSVEIVEVVVVVSIVELVVKDASTTEGVAVEEVAKTSSKHNRKIKGINTL